MKVACHICGDPMPAPRKPAKTTLGVIDRCADCDLQRAVGNVKTVKVANYHRMSMVQRKHALSSARGTAKSSATKKGTVTNAR